MEARMHLLLGVLCIMATWVSSDGENGEHQCYSRFDYEYKVIQKLAQLEEMQIKLEENLNKRESGDTEQKNEMRKISELVDNALEEFEKQKRSAREVRYELANVKSQLAVLENSQPEKCQTGEIDFFEDLNCTKEQDFCSQSVVADFDPPFRNVPLVMRAFSYLDSNTDRNLRVLVAVADLTRRGLKLMVGTWDDSILYGTRVSWIACPRRQ